MITDILRPIGSTDDSTSEMKKEQALTQSQQINNKRALLNSYITNPNSTNEDFNKIIEQYPDNVPYSMIEALNYCSSNVTVFPMINSMINNPSHYYRTDMGPYLLQYAKNHNPHNFAFTKNVTYTNNPYYNQGVSNSEFNSIWKEVRRKYPTLKDSDKDQLLAIYPTIDQLKYELGYNSDQIKSKVTTDDIVAPKIDLSTPTTKEELYRYYSNLAILYSNFNDNIFGNINSINSKDQLKDLRYLFVTLHNDPKDLQYMQSLYGTEYGQWVYNMIVNYMKLSNPQYLITSICLSPTHTDLDTIESSLINIFDKVLSILPKDVIIVPVDLNICKFFGANDLTKGSFSKYNKHLVCNAMISNNESAYQELMGIANGNIKKVTVKRDLIYNTNHVINRLRSSEVILDVPKITNTTNIDATSSASTFISSMKDVAPEPTTPFEYTNKEYTNEEFNQILFTLDKYNIMYIARSIKNHKDGSAAMNGTPYIVMRKGKDKRLYYLNPSITVAYSLQRDYKVEEPRERLYCQDNVPLKEVYNFKRKCNDHFANSQQKPIFYNTDFAYSIYIASQIRNRDHYEEGHNTPRILVLDFETETGALKARDTSKTNDAKCRLISLFDIIDKKFYCAVLKDPQYHSNVDLSTLTEHDGYSVVIDEFIDEKDLWYWLNNKISMLDPDIITGWNVERFDLTYAIVRCRTLGIELRSKYGPFTFIYSRDSNGRSKCAVCADGLVVLDYQKLYRACQFIKRENYKLEYICQIELKRGKRELIIDDHNKMYQNYLIDYIKYNIEDDERILDLENKLNYIKFQFEMCNVCNISWNEIFSKTKLIDGLVYNHAYDLNHSYLKERNVVDKSNLNLNNILSKDIQQYIITSGDQTINVSATPSTDNGNAINRSNDDSGADILDLTEYAVEEEVEEGDKGYEGAVVLEPQKGVKELVADLDASQMYPRLMIRSNIFKDTLCGIIAIDYEKYAEAWLYNRDAFPNEILIKLFNTGNDQIVKMSKGQFEQYLQDKILTPFGTIYWKPSIKRSLVSDILITLIANRSKYKKLRDEVTEKYTASKEANDTDSMKEYARLMDRYDNLQTAYKSLINSFYGVMGMLMYRLSDMFSAASITASGRELTRMVAHYGSKYMDTMIEEKNPKVPFDHVPIDCKTLIGMEDIVNRPNILYGDTDSVFVHIGKVVNGIFGSDISMDEKLDHSWQVIDNVADYLNNYVIRNILERKGIDFFDADKKYNYEFKKELIMSKILFGSQKKHYAMRLVIKEGKRLDKIVIKGMLAIKSDTPRFSRNLLNNLTEYILKDYDANNIAVSNRAMMDMYDKATKEIASLIHDGIVDIGRPVSLTQDIQHYSTIQAHIRGMLLYDIIYNHDYMFMDKAYQFYISNINFEKIGMTEAQILEKFKKKYGHMKWYEPMMRTYKKDTFFGSICIPTDSDALDTTIFTIDEERTKKTVIKEKIQDLMKLVGISVLDEEDIFKAKKNALKKFDFAALGHPVGFDGAGML